MTWDEWGGLARAPRSACGVNDGERQQGSHSRDLEARKAWLSWEKGGAFTVDEDDQGRVLVGLRRDEQVERLAGVGCARVRNLKVGGVVGHD